MTGLAGVSISPWVWAISTGHFANIGSFAYMSIMGLTSAVGWAIVAYRNSLKGFRPPPGVRYTASDPEFGTMLPDTGLVLDHHTFENIVRAEAHGIPFTYFEAVDASGRVGYLLVDLPGRLPDIHAVRRNTGQTQPATLLPLRGKLTKRTKNFRFEAGPSSPADAFFWQFITEPMSLHLDKMTVHEWQIHGRSLIGLPRVNANSPTKVWERLQTSAEELIALAAAIPDHLYEPDDSRPPAIEWNVLGAPSDAPRPPGAEGPDPSTSGPTSPGAPPAAR